jgi:hypothetical protein
MRHEPQPTQPPTPDQVAAAHAIIDDGAYKQGTFENTITQLFHGDTPALQDDINQLVVDMSTRHQADAVISQVEPDHEPTLADMKAYWAPKDTDGQPITTDTKAAEKYYRKNAKDMTEGEVDAAGRALTIMKVVDAVAAGADGSEVVRVVDEHKSKSIPKLERCHERGDGVGAILGAVLPDKPAVITPEEPRTTPNKVTKAAQKAADVTTAPKGLENAKPEEVKEYLTKQLEAARTAFAQVVAETDRKGKVLPGHKRQLDKLEAAYVAARDSLAMHEIGTAIEERVQGVIAQERDELVKNEIPFTVDAKCSGFATTDEYDQYVKNLQEGQNTKPLFEHEKQIALAEIQASEPTPTKEKFLIELELQNPQQHTALVENAKAFAKQRMTDRVNAELGLGKPLSSDEAENVRAAAFDSFIDQGIQELIFDNQNQRAIEMATRKVIENDVRSEVIERVNGHIDNTYDIDDLREQATQEMRNYFESAEGRAKIVASALEERTKLSAVYDKSNEAIQTEIEPDTRSRIKKIFNGVRHPVKTKMGATAFASWWARQAVPQGTTMRERVLNTFMNKEVRRANIKKSLALALPGAAIGFFIAPVIAAAPVAGMFGALASKGMSRSLLRHSIDKKGAAVTGKSVNKEQTERQLATDSERLQQLVNADGTIDSQDITAGMREMSSRIMKRNRQRMAVSVGAGALGAVVGGAVASWMGFTGRAGIDHPTDSGQQHLPQVTGNGGKVVPNTLPTTTTAETVVPTSTAMPTTTAPRVTTSTVAETSTTAAPTTTVRPTTTTSTMVPSTTDQVNGGAPVPVEANSTTTSTTVAETSTTAAPTTTVRPTTTTTSTTTAPTTTSTTVEQTTTTTTAPNTPPTGGQTPPVTPQTPGSTTPPTNPQTPVTPRTGGSPEPGGGYPDATPAPNTTPTPVDLTGTKSPWEWSQKQNINITEVAERARLDGHSVKWHNQGTQNAWLEIDGKSDTQSVVNVLDKYKSTPTPPVTPVPSTPPVSTTPTNGNTPAAPNTPSTNGVVEPARGTVRMKVLDGKGFSTDVESAGIVPKGYGDKLATYLKDQGMADGNHIPGFKDGRMFHVSGDYSTWSLDALHALKQFKLDNGLALEDELTN